MTRVAALESPTVRVSTDPRAFWAAWPHLLSQQPHPSPFTRPWWVRHVTQDTPAPLLIHDADGPVGGIALTSRRRLGVEVLRPAGHGVPCPDHVDLVALPGREQDVAEAFGRWFARPGARLLDLSGAPERSLAAAALGVAAQPVDVAPYEPLTGSFLATRSASFRRNVRRTEKRLADLGAQQWTATSADVGAALDAFEALHRDRPDRAPLLREMARLRPAITEAVACGEARVDVLEVGGRPAAVSVAFLVAGRLALYQLARSTERHHDGAGTALLVRVVERAALEGCTEVDLLRGDEAYKSRFATHRRVLTRVRAAHGVRARAALLGQVAARAAVRRLRRLRGRRGPAPA